MSTHHHSTYLHKTSPLYYLFIITIHIPKTNPPIPIYHYLSTHISNSLSPTNPPRTPGVVTIKKHY